MSRFDFIFFAEGTLSSKPLIRIYGN